MWEYAELEIMLRRREEAGYPVEMRLFNLQREETRFPRKPPKAYADIQPDELRHRPAVERGKQLGKALFAEEAIREGLRTARTVAGATADTALRVRLYIDPEADPELHKLPWETLCDETGEPLFAGSRMLFSRYLTSTNASRQRPIRSRADSRALIAVATHEEAADIAGLQPVRVTEERQRAEEGFQKAGIACRVLATGEAGSLGPATADSLLTQLDNGFDILYLVCHGAFQGGRKPVLYLEDGPVDPARLVERIRHSHMQPRLVILASCDSAGGDAAEILCAFGPQLVEAGIPAVIAMQEKLLMGTLRIFLPAFLAELAKAGGQIDRAMGIARERTKEAGCRDFWAPVLFSRLTTGRLWDTEEARQRRIFNVPPLPPGYVQRPALTGEVVKALTSGKHAVVLGAGGFGKTTLAIDAVHREEIADAFPDGVLWTSIGTRPELHTILSDLYVQVTGEKPEVAGLEQIGRSFAPALAGRRCLMVFDDIWRAEDLEPFVGLKGPVLLVTTRNQMLIEEAGQAGWCEVHVEAMGPEEAMAFLGRGLELQHPAPDAFGRLAGQLGGWPLLLDLVNARLREEAKSGRGIEFVSKLFEKKGVLGFDRRDSRSRSAAVASSVEAGLERAEELFPGLADKAMEISIFDDNTSIPLQVLQELWGLDEFDLEEEVLRPLDNLSVLRWHREAREVRLHRLIDRALHERLKKSGRPVEAVHRRLIEAWGDPCRLRHNYAWRWFGWHCREAGELERLKSLLRDFHWLHAKLDATDINGLLGEFELLPDDDEEIELLQSALLLSAHVLAKDKSQLAGQLLGRLPAEDALRAEMETKALQMRGPWLRPVRPSLTAPGGALLLTLAGHKSQVLGLAVTPDGKHVVSASHDRTLKVWDLDTGADLRTLEGHRKSVNVAAVTPDGTRAVSGSADNTLKIWDMATGRELRTLEGHTDSVIHVAVTPDGTRVVSGSADRTLKVWDLATGEELRTLTGHTKMVIHLVVAPDGRRVVSGASDATVRVWDLDTGAELRTLTGHTAWVYAVAVTPDGTEVISASKDGTVKVWDLATGEVVRTLKEHTGWVFGVVVTPDGKQLVSSANDQTLKVWDLSTGKKLRTIKGHTDSVWELAVTPDGKRVVSASFDKTLKVWDITSGRRLRTPAGSMEKVKSAAVGQDRRWTVSASKDKTLKAWTLATGTKLLTPVGHTHCVVALAVTPDGARAISASTDRTLKIWDLATGTELRKLTGHKNSIYGVSVTPDGTRAISGAWDDTLKVWDLETGAELRTLAGHTSCVNGVAVTPDGTRAVSTSEDKTLKLWDLATGNVLHTMAGHKSYVNAVAVTTDGQRAISASTDKTLKVWDLTTGAEVLTMEGHTHYVKAVAVTPDGRRAVSASSDRTLKVWEIATGTLLLTLTGHENYVNAVVVTPDGDRAVSASEDRTLKVWDLGTGRCLATFELDFAARCCAIAGGNRVFAGDKEGGVHYLALEGFAPGVR